MEIDLECSRITKVILPAIRAYVAEALAEKHEYRQEQIARNLGVDQVAVSKYLNRKYSREVAKMLSYIKDNKLGIKIVDDIAGKKGHDAVGIDINSLCIVILKSEMKMVN